jgi:hypothetical protein
VVICSENLHSTLSFGMVERINICNCICEKQKTVNVAVLLSAILSTPKAKAQFYFHCVHIPCIQQFSLTK